MGACAVGILHRAYTRGSSVPAREVSMRADSLVHVQAFTKIDDHSYQVVSKKGGKVTITSKVVVSADGKTRTTTQTGTDAQGRPVNNTIVYEKM
jgi:flavin-dependent dehydrogenase